MTEPFLTIDAVAAHLSVHANTLRSWMKQGMPCYRIGRVVRFKASEVDAWVAEVAAKGSRRDRLASVLSEALAEVRP